MDPTDDIKKFEKLMTDLVEGLLGRGRIEIFTPMMNPKTVQLGDVREPLTDINETKLEVIVTMEIPGAKKDDIDIHATPSSLEIKAKLTKTMDAQGIHSTSTQRFQKQLTLPEEVDPKSIKATYKNGILEVAMKKTVKSKGTKIKVE
ncbi:MAG: Hsp20/alpha crystallin family protein [Candidatus Altiarchaeota archaeon]|nr:Hsp20/alpha crystallin family protein [Candidatus Altiarchaeota archaeon]